MVWKIVYHNEYLSLLPQYNSLWSFLVAWEETGAWGTGQYINGRYITLMYLINYNAGQPQNVLIDYYMYFEPFSGLGLGVVRSSKYLTLSS